MKTISKERLAEIGKSLDNENISYSEIAELDAAAQAMGIDNTDEMTAIDVYLELEQKL